MAQVRRPARGGATGLPAGWAPPRKAAPHARERRPRRASRASSGELHLAAGRRARGHPAAGPDPGAGPGGTAAGGTRRRDRRLPGAGRHRGQARARFPAVPAPPCSPCSACWSWRMPRAAARLVSLVLDNHKVDGVAPTVGRLLVAAALILFANVVTFGLLYWQLDGGGRRVASPCPRRSPTSSSHRRPRRGWPPPGWQPRFGGLPLRRVHQRRRVQPDRHDAPDPAGQGR